MAVMTARQHHFSVVLKLDQVSSVTPGAMRELLTRGHVPRVRLAS